MVFEDGNGICKGNNEVLRGRRWFVESPEVLAI